MQRLFPNVCSGEGLPVGFVESGEGQRLGVGDQIGEPVVLASEVVDCSISHRSGKRKLSQLIGGFVESDDLKRVRVFWSYSP